MNRYLYFAVFMSGMTTLAAELSASRLLGNVFGTSNLVWASIIGLILLYLTVGYFIGGRWADRSPSAATFYTILTWGAFTVGLIPIASRPMLLWAARGMEVLNAPVAGGAFLATLLLFVVPITLLGCVSPFAIRLVVRSVGETGGVAGRVYAISTLGSLLGTFIPILILIPMVGTRLTYLSYAGLLLLVALFGLVQVNRRRALLHSWMLVALIGLGVWAATGSVKPIDGLVYETESAYNFIQVVERGNTRYLLLNEGQGIHSVYTPGSLTTISGGRGVWDYFLAGPFFNHPPYYPRQVTSMASVGLAAGTIPKQYSEVFGPIPIDGIEIDAEIVAVGREHFDMREPNLNVIVADGRAALARSPNTYSVIGVDAYRLPYIPWQLTTQEFFVEARDHLTPDGVVIINVGRTATDRRLIEAMVGTLQSVFPSVYVLDVPETFNSILYATVQPTQVENLSVNLALLPPEAHPFLRLTLEHAVANLQPTPASDVVFTDDRAPVELLTNAIVLNFILGGDLLTLRGA